jgi:hypothetical protein
MARLQILELPEGSGDDRPPFVLVVDQCMPQRITLGADAPYRDFWQDLADKIGARGVIVTPETVEIPANDTSAYHGNSDVKPAFDLKLGDRNVQSIVESVVRQTPQGPRPGKVVSHAAELTDIARDMDRLAKWRDELTDALGMDRGSSWDDVRSAACGIREQRDAQAAELDRLCAGEEPITDEGVTPNPGQWIWHWNRATPEKRLSMAAQIQDGMTRSNNCFMADHEAQIERLRAETERLRANPNASTPDA